ncbi:MAG: GNAT family N-acetyltransferase [Bacteroidota bacterium]
MYSVELIPLDRFNWEECLAIQISPEQENFVPPILYSLAQAKFESLTPFGVRLSGKMIGFLMHGEFSGICWLNRILIDADYQNQGIGEMAVKKWIQKMVYKVNCKEIRTSYARENYSAAQFFEKLGFIPIDDGLKEEIVARYER